tara:strand:- start:8493 stop:10160 length:1668 start_codon:yes stop_codon:yes gene_type:complete
MINENPITFIEAKKLIESASYSSSIKLRLMTSSTINQLNHFLIGTLAKKGIKPQIENLDFGTFHQTLTSKKKDDVKEIAILLPWDFIKCIDWRLGGVDKIITNPMSVLDEAEKFSNNIKKRNFKKIIYQKAPIFGAFGSKEIENKVLLNLELIALELGATILDTNHFNLQSYLHSGLAIKSSSLGIIAQIISSDLTTNYDQIKKVIITDLDMTFWEGVLGEDGLDGISSDPKGNSYYNFIYQRQLRRFKNSGVLLCVVSKNDLDLVTQALKSNKFELGYEDFVSIQSSYETKSSHIKLLSETLNLGLDSFVFIDDNPVEIAQVSSALPKVTCLKFSNEPDLFNIFLDNLNSLFTIKSLTKEDAERTHLYKKMLDNKKVMNSNVNSEDNDVNLDNFLKSQDMKLRLKTCTLSDYQRPYQLINKTNQFNMNGIRRKEDEIIDVIKNGGYLLSAELIDNAGSHGEIIAILIDQTGNVLSFVMSCRVFQRKVELGFLHAVIKFLNMDLNIEWIRTMRNEPFEKFVLKLFPKNTSKKFVIKKEKLKDIYCTGSKLFEFLN